MMAASAPLQTLLSAAALVMLTLSNHAAQAAGLAELRKVQMAVEDYARAYENRDPVAISNSFPKAFYTVVSNDPAHTTAERRAFLQEWFETFFGRFPPADTPALDAHWSRWKNRTLDLTETFPTSEGGRLFKVSVRGTYNLQERQWEARDTLIAVQENDQWFLMDPALSHLRRVMRLAYPMITDADAKGTARMFRLEN